MSSSLRSFGSIAVLQDPLKNNHYLEHHQLEHHQLKERENTHWWTTHWLSALPRSVTHYFLLHFMGQSKSHSHAQVHRVKMYNPLTWRDTTVRGPEFEWRISKSTSQLQDLYQLYKSLDLCVRPNSPSLLSLSRQWVLLWDHLVPFLLEPHLLVKTISLHPIIFL